jgi:predicted phage terminase large subunit-like protein
LVSDDGARSPTITASIEDTVYKAIDYALHPTRRKIIWNGTPFNSNDPLYKAAESGAWYVNVFPVCNTFPCNPEEFRGAWEDRFTYEYVRGQYDKAVLAGKVDSFMQELMLRIISDDDRLVFDHDLVWYDSKRVQQNKERFNFYITTDFATSEGKASDYSVISVWAYNNNGDWLLVDGICARQLMDKNIDDLFRLAQMYRPQQVGVEVSGQQGGFVSWIYDQMATRNIYFTLASENNNGKAGIRPATNKMERFNVVLPWFKTKKIWLPEDMREHPLVLELLEELRYASPKGFKSKHDDAIDTVSMLAKLSPWKPTEETVDVKTGDMFEEDEEVSGGAYSSYIV